MHGAGHPSWGQSAPARVSLSAHAPFPPQVCCLPRSPWSTSSQGPLPRVWAAAPAAAAAALTAPPVLPRPGAPPAPSLPPAGPSEGQDPAPHAPLSCQERRRLMHRIYLISRSPCQTIRPDVESLDMSVCPGSVQVLLYSGDRERLQGQDRAALSNQGLCWRTGRGLWAASFLRGSQATSHPGHSVSTIRKPAQGWRPSRALPLNLFPFPCLPP